MSKICAGAPGGVVEIRPSWDVANRDARRLVAGRRERRYDLLRWLWQHSSLARLHHCRLTATGQLVSLRRAVGGAYWHGLQTCGSVWACPVCSSVIRTRRAMVIEAGAKAWLAQEGCSLAFLTLTVRHQRWESLAALYGGLAASWKFLREHKWWRSLGFSGVVRASEVTYGRNGWHPHLHLLLFVRGELVLGDVESELRRRWQSAVVGAGLSATSLARGVRLQPISYEDHGGVGGYLSKVLDEHGSSWDVGSELARSDIKSSRGGLSPFELLDRATCGEAFAVRAWREYEQATFGRRAIEASRSLGLQWKSDDELVQEDQGGELVMTLFRSDYRRLALAGYAAAVLEAEETGVGAVDFVGALLSLLGGE